MKKIIASALVIAVLGALTVGSTLAVFSDREVIAGNTVATGTLELTLNHTEGKPYAIADAYPGFVDDWEYIDIYNSGDDPFEAYMSFEQTGGATALYNELTMRLETAGGDGLCDTDDFAENVIYDGRLADFVNPTLVSSIDFWHLANEEEGDASTPEDNIRAGWTERVCQQLGVHPDAHESVMGKSVTFDEIVDAMQDNDSTAPALEELDEEVVEE